MKRLLMLVVLSGCHEAAKRAPDAGPSCPAPTLKAAHTTGPLTIDGKLEEPDWVKTATTGAFGLEADGSQTSPHTELRALWDEEALTLGLYAADEDFVRTDALHVTVDGQPFTVLANAPASADGGVAVAIDADGTFDDPADDDEEWLAELRLDWARLGGRPHDVEVAVWREDTPKGAPARRVSWARCGGRSSAGRVVLVPAPPR
jgi:hypothetical protein